VQEISPRFVILGFVATPAARRLKAGHGTLRRLRAGLKRTHSRPPSREVLSLVQKGLGTVAASSHGRVAPTASVPRALAICTILCADCVIRNVLADRQKAVNFCCCFYLVLRPGAVSSRVYNNHSARAPSSPPWIGRK
jgi:hypothetical protein